MKRTGLLGSGMRPEDKAVNTALGGGMFRVRYADDEARHPWLPLLLDAYAIIDKGVAEAIEGEAMRRQVKLACGKGCAACCRTHRDIPLYPLEAVGIYWFCAEKMNPAVREILKGRLSRFREGGACPFLIDSSCSIHPVRPVACRQFNVFGTPCAEGEDPFHTRRRDVLTPLKEYLEKAFIVMMPFYGITKEADKGRAARQGLLHGQAVNLKAYNWRALRKRMDAFDAGAR